MADALELGHQGDQPGPDQAAAFVPTGKLPHRGFWQWAHHPG